MFANQQRKSRFKFFDYWQVTRILVTTINVFVRLSPRNGHFGLLDMRERAEKIGGEFSLTSQPAGGTHLVITVVTGPSSIPGPNQSTNGSASALNGERDARA